MSISQNRSSFSLLCLWPPRVRSLISLTALICLLSLGLPLRSEISFYGVALIIGPLMGSFITEPAAMTVTALVLSLALGALLPTLVAMACFWWLPSL